MTAAQPAPQILVRLLVVAIFAMCMMIGFVAWPRLFGTRHLAHVAIATIPPGASIEIEGHAIGRAEGSGLDVPDLEIGRAYPVVARLDGYEPQQGVVQPRSGGTSLELRLRALAATVELDSQPSGATVEIAGKQVGNTPLRLSSLAPSSSAVVVFHKAGYQDATAQLDVPDAGKTMRMVQPLVVAAELARIELDSDPPGAQVVQNGQLLAGVQTPAQVLVEADHTVKFALTMQHKVPAIIELTPGHGAEIVKHAKLVEGFTVAVDANLDGMKLTLSPSCQQVALPATCVVPKGNYQLELEGPTNAHVQKNLAISADTAVHLQLGYVEASAEHQIVLGPGRTTKKVTLEVGRRSVTVTGEDGPHNAVVTVKAGATVSVQ